MIRFTLQWSVFANLTVLDNIDVFKDPLLLQHSDITDPAKFDVCFDELTHGIRFCFYLATFVF